MITECNKVFLGDQPLMMVVAETIPETLDIHSILTQLTT
jgi:hypothetical protein